MDIIHKDKSQRFLTIPVRFLAKTDMSHRNNCQRGSKSPSNSQGFHQQSTVSAVGLTITGMSNKRTGPISTRVGWEGGDGGLLLENFLRRPNFQNKPTTKPCLQQNCVYYIFYAILKWRRNGYKQTSINCQYAMILPMAIAAARKMKMSPEKIDDTRLKPVFHLRIFSREATFFELFFSSEQIIVFHAKRNLQH